ncbi:hypothetical protein GDI0577 [Gluconacetobacter diazotrophicus PA1 5]|uniref:Uncharacterized protein n=1 Tax=Gluconacetobacter diazotrophicus (strain ATCC 49037 / DSM 5601 / CCUG 37298 / CIP 103539 / LMG 7603 / PAl5) TaxID=272568 RepID=A9H8D8_GLUDA|nr:hypothetical protein GDI0577 [Gluconacetobacter diazotrophicus PA1 5]
MSWSLARRPEQAVRPRTVFYGVEAYIMPMNNLYPDNRKNR